MFGNKHEKEVRNAIKWLATEHSFFNDLKDDLNFLDRDIKKAIPKESVADIKRILKDCKAIGRAERRLETHEQHVEDTIKKIQEHVVDIKGMSVGNIHKLLQHLHTEAAELIRVSSLFEGRIMELAHHLQTAVKKHETEKAQQCIMEMGEVVENTQKWITALSVDLQKAKDLVHESGIVEVSKRAGEVMSVPISSMSKEERDRRISEIVKMNQNKVTPVIACESLILRIYEFLDKLPTDEVLESLPKAAFIRRPRIPIFEAHIRDLHPYNVWRNSLGSLSLGSYDVSFQRSAQYSLHHLGENGYDKEKEEIATTLGGMIHVKEINPRGKLSIFVKKVKEERASVKKRALVMLHKLDKLWRKYQK
jgi:hypothetical protein